LYDTTVTVGIYFVVIIATSGDADVCCIRAVVDDVLALGDSIPDDIATRFVVAIITTATYTYIHATTSSLA